MSTLGLTALGLNVFAAALWWVLVSINPDPIRLSAAILITALVAQIALLQR